LNYLIYFATVDTNTIIILKLIQIKSNLISDFGNGVIK